MHTHKKSEQTRQQLKRIKFTPRNKTPWIQFMKKIQTNQALSIIKYMHMTPIIEIEK